MLQLRLHMITTEDTELAWAAGFFDGEGHTRRIGKGGLRISVAQQKQELLQRFKLAVGAIGIVAGPYNSGARKNPIYVWSCANTRGCDMVANKLWPFLSEPKRIQMLTAGFKLGVIRTPKIGRPRNKSRTIPRCHPDRSHRALGLCNSCYVMKRRKGLNGK